MQDLSGVDTLVYTIRRTEPWWAYLSQQMGFRKIWTVSDLRGDGDFCVVDEFNKTMRRIHRSPVVASDLVTAKELEDIVARCRLLRFLPRRRARAMVLAMAEVFVGIIEKTKPNVVISFPIDRYVSDVLRLMALKRRIPYFEMTVGPLPETVMFLNRGKLCRVPKTPDVKVIDAYIERISQDYFKPSYVNKSVNRFSKLKFLKVFSYFKLRGVAFKNISILKRDFFNLHYLDSQAFLGHKPKLTDMSVLDMLEQDWEKRLNDAPEGRRVFLGLAVFPEAAIDYWISDLKLIEYEDLVVNKAQEFSDNGFHVFIKDHPLQFGFRQADLLVRLKAIPNVTLVPYEVSGKAMVSRTDVTVTTTGTIGLEAAIIGKKAVIVDNYYATEGDFIVVKNSDCEGLADRVKDFPVTEDLVDRQRRIVRNLLEGSCSGEFYAFETYEAGKECEQTIDLGKAMGEHLTSLLRVRDSLEPF